MSPETTPNGDRSGVILDIDGTLIDSNDAHAQAWVDVLRERGLDIPFEKIRPLIGMGADKIIPMLVNQPEESREGKLLKERRKEIFHAKYLPEVHPFPGIRSLLERMLDDGFVLVAATSSSEAKALLEVAGVADLIAAATGSDDAESSKPDPDVIEAALEKCGCRGERAIFLGDTPYDIEAATRAGIPAVALRCGGWGDEELEGAVAIYDHPADLLEKYEDSPFHRIHARLSEE